MLVQGVAIGTRRLDAVNMIFETNRSSRRFESGGRCPIEAAAGEVEWLWMVPRRNGIGVTLVDPGELTREILGPGTRKRAGFFRTPHSARVRQELIGSCRAIFQPHAEAAVRSIAESGFEVPFGKSLDALAMIPGGQPIVIADLRTDDGSALLAGELDLG